MRIATMVEKTIVAFSAVLAGAAILAMAILIPVDVLGRYLFGKPTLIAVEVAVYLLVCLIFLGLVYTAHAGRHITVEHLTAISPPGVPP